MITNILATVVVSLVTNVTEFPVPTNPLWYSFAANIDPDRFNKPPKQKYVVTRIVQRTTVAFDWEHEKRVVDIDKPLHMSVELYSVETTSKWVRSEIKDEFEARMITGEVTLTNSLHPPINQNQ